MGVMADPKSGNADKKAERDARLAKALRDNLKRRKVGAREDKPPKKEDRSS